MPTNPEDWAKPIETPPSWNENQLKANQLTNAPTMATPRYFKELRMLVDNLMIQSKGISPTREVSLAYTQMQRGSMWLGKVLQGMYDPNPYPESTNVSSAKIEERADQAKDSPAMFEGAPSADVDRTAAIKWYRLKLDGVISQTNHPPFGHYSQLAKDAFEEAKMWFGQELNNIRLAGLKDE